MSATAVHSWTCTGCGRRVPLRVDVCHCGVAREQAALATPAGQARPSTGVRRSAPSGGRAIWRTLPRDVKALVVASGLVFAAGLCWLGFGPQTRDAPPPILGYVDAPPPLHPSPPAPRFKLPWWK